MKVIIFLYLHLHVVEHTAPSSSLYVLSGQDLHSDWADSSWYESLGQSKQLLADSSQYCPAGHSTKIDTKEPQHAISNNVAF